MTIYVAEIEGLAVAAFHAETDIAADDLAAADWFRADLGALKCGGAAVWDGKTNIHVREATEDERATWDSSRARAIIDSETDADDKDCLTFLGRLDPDDDE